MVIQHTSHKQSPGKPDAFTTLAVKGTGDNGSTFIPDYSRIANVMTTSVNCSISTSYGRFSGGSIQTPTHRTYPGYVTTPTNSNIELSNSVFTIDYWVYHNDIGGGSTPHTHFVSAMTGGSAIGGLVAGLSSDSNIYLYVSFDNVTWGISGLSMGTNTGVGWDHYAICRDEYNNWYTFKGGVLKGKTSNSGTLPVRTEVFCIGSWGYVYNLYGYIQMFRLKKGICLWSGSSIGTQYFTPPTRRISSAAI